MRAKRMIVAVAAVAMTATTARAQDAAQVFHKCMPCHRMGPGTKTVVPGIKDEKDIHNLWAYLNQFGLDGKKK
jgi:cytochrome c2